MELIYINNEISSVFSSQVVALLNYYSNTGAFKKIILLCGIKNENYKQQYQKELSSATFQFVFFKTYANYPFFNFLTSNSVSRTLSKLNCSYENTVIHIRGESTAYLSILGINNKFKTLEKTLVDVRGAALEEINEFQGHNFFKRTLKNINAKKGIKSLRKFKHITTVSRSLRSYIANKSGIDISKISVVPCLASNEFIYNKMLRVSVRKRLGIAEHEKILIFTSGGTAAWQNNEEISKLNKSFRVLNLSPSNIRAENVINTHVPYSEVAQYLCASDAAVIYRNSSIVNKVSSPVKFSEYVCAGLPVITNTNVDQITDHIKSTGHGIFINDLVELSEGMVSDLMKIDREEISSIGTTKFGIERIASDYLELYKLLIH